jgi:HKD family nuclease
MTINNPNSPINNNSNIGDIDPGITNWPQVIDFSDWLKNLKETIVKIPEHPGDNGITRTIYQKIFNDRAEFDIWVESNRLTDTELRSVLAEWDSTHNIVRTETVFEINEIGKSGIL